MVRVAPEDDTAVYLASTGTRNLWVSKNGGMESWKTIDNSKVTGVQDFAVESTDVVYVLDTAAGSGVSKTTNAGASYGTTKEPTQGINGYMLHLASNGDVLVGGSDGYISYSKDGGSTFERTIDLGTGNAVVTTDVDYADNNRIYVGIGTSLKRHKATTATSPPAGTRGTMAYTITGIAHVEGATYAVSSDGANSNLDMSFKVHTAGSTALAEWTTTAATGEAYTSGPRVVKVSMSGGKPRLWAIDTNTPDLESYTDATSLQAPALVSPEDEASISINTASGKAYDITFIFERYSDSDVKDATLQIATDADFNAIVHTGTYTGITTNTIAKVVGPFANDGGGTVEYLPGATYYWRVRTTTPLNSPWSETRSFTVESLEAPFDVSGPAVGSGEVSTMPVLTWGAYPGAIHYELALSEDPSFQIPEWSHNVDNNFYAVADALDYSTTYYWRVRGVTGESYTVRRSVVVPAGPWVTGVFTTEAEPVVEEPDVITITEPAPPQKITVVEIPGATRVVQQAIPEWMLLTIIIIGAVLVIALVVLIVRTRRIA